MKKIISLIGIVAIMLSMTLTAFAGDVPEALGYEDDAQIFIGTLKDFEIDDSSSIEVINAQVLPTRKIKGEVPINELQTYELCYFGKVIAEKDTEYLFGWLADNSVWVYAIESYDEKDIKLQITDEFAERIQDSLENGVYARLEQERVSLGTQISFAEFLYVKPMSGSNVKKVTLRYQDELHEVDVDEFEKVAKEIMITNVKNDRLHDEIAKPKQMKPYKTNLYIELLDENEQWIGYAAVSRHGEVDRYALMMSRLMNKDYEMKKEDLQKLYSLLPKDVQKNIVVPESSVKPLELLDITEKNYTPWIVGGGVTIFVIAFIIGFVVKKRR